MTIKDNGGEINEWVCILTLLAYYLYLYYVLQKPCVIFTSVIPHLHIS